MIKYNTQFALQNWLACQINLAHKIS